MRRNVEEIEMEISELPPSELRKFRAWFEEFDAANWDRQIEEDVNSGKLDELANVAISDHKAGKSRKL